MSNEAKEMQLGREALILMQKSWPEHFGCLFEMGQKAFETAFDKYPHFKTYFAFTDDQWRKDERFKKVVLGLEQTLAQGVTVFCEPKSSEEQNDSITEYISLLEEIGGLHKGIVPTMEPKHIDMFLVLVPAVVVDCIEKKRKTGPFEAAEKQQLIECWTALSKFIAKHMRAGWDKSVVPKTPKLKKAYRRKTMSISSVDSNSDSESPPKRATSVGSNQRPAKK
uniref:Globin family profile domain-containing protein n=1 Tax=Plectus sambesii TaxID=2011161 RepID=A0A914WQJ6_9BILA